MSSKFCARLVVGQFSHFLFRLFADRPESRNSISESTSWAPILAQTVYYFLAYFPVRKKIPHPENSQIQFVVPTGRMGNFGDILAGYYAKRMGLPMSKLVVATNSNDILARFWRSGRCEQLTRLRLLIVAWAWVMGS